MSNKCTVPNCEKRRYSVSRKYCLVHWRRMSPQGGKDRARELARLRDDDTCQDCKKKWVKAWRKFDVHHLNGLCGKMTHEYDSPKDIRGLITLCHRCHIANHVTTMTGKKKTTDAMIERIQELRLQGLSYWAISKKVGVSKPIVGKHLSGIAKYKLDKIRSKI